MRLTIFPTKTRLDQTGSKHVLTIHMGDSEVLYTDPDVVERLADSLKYAQKMMRMKGKLKECPVCLRGTYVGTFNDGERWFVGCGRCGIRTMSATSKKKAEENWNNIRRF